jgi:hypothetical protein
MRPCEAILRIGRAKIKENNGGGEFKYETFDTYKNFYKCHNVPPPSTTIKNKINMFVRVEKKKTYCLQHFPRSCGNPNQ